MVRVLFGEGGEQVGLAAGGRCDNRLALVVSALVAGPAVKPTMGPVELSRPKLRDTDERF